MPTPQGWEIILTGILVAIVLFMLRPGMKNMLATSRDAQSGDWRGLLLPAVLLVGFVVLLVLLVSS